MICRATYQWSAQIALPMVHNVHVVYCFKIWLITGQAFCESHCVRVAELGYPTDLKEFLKSGGSSVWMRSLTKFQKCWRDPLQISKLHQKHKEPLIYCTLACTGSYLQTASRTSQGREQDVSLSS